MKKKILAMALVIVTLVTVLTGCAYRYDRKDMSKYVSVADNYAGLVALLNSITIEGADFGPYVKGNDYKRDDKVLEKIDSILAGKIATDAEKLGGETLFGYRQKIFYAYYCTVEKDGVTYYFDTANMNDAKLQSFLSNPTYTNGVANKELVTGDEVQKTIFEALMKDGGLKIADYKYDSITTGTDELKAGDVVFVSYTCTYTDEAGASKSITAKNLLITVEDIPEIEGEQTTPTKIGQLLVGKKIGKIEGTTENPLEYVSGGVTYKMDSLTVDYMIKEGKEVEVPFVATADKEYTNAANTATAAKIKVAEGDVITYHVYPAYVNAIEERSATAIIKTVFGESISTSSLGIFADDARLKPLVENIVTLKSAYDTANSAAGSSPTEEQKKTKEEARKALDEALDKLPSDIFKIVGETAVMTEYKKSVYTSLEDAYDAEIMEQLGKKIWDWVETNVKVDTAKLPKAAVKEAKNRILEGHKNDYHTGTDSTTKIAYSDTYTFQEYLAAIVYSGKDVDATVEAAAQAEVVDIMRVYAVAQKFSDNVTRVTDADISLYVEQNYFLIYYNLVINGQWTSTGYPSPEQIREIYGDTALRCALTFDRIMDYFLATETDADGHVSYTTIKKITYTKFPG